MAIAVLQESASVDNAPSPSAVSPGELDRRVTARLSAADAAWLQAARLKYGPALQVVDISSGGILVESEGAPPAIGSNVVFELTGPTGTSLAPARVVRSQQAAAGRHRYACAFKRPLSMDTATAAVRDQSAAQTPSPRPSWQRVVARFRNGQVVRGFTNDFHPSKPHLHLTPEDRPDTNLFIAIAQLKAIFFVREFAGDPTRVDRTDFGASSHGRKVEVTFEDGEVLVGSTLAYRADGSGFFVQPADTESNNMRVFVGPAATRHIRLL